MKKSILCFIILLIGSTAYSQNLSIFNIDASAFPNVKANFYAFDAGWNQQFPDKSALEIKENGLTRDIVNVICPTPKTPTVLSSVLVMDISNSINGIHLDIAKAAAKVWVNALTTDNSECALITFNHFNYFNQDFTTDKTKLLKAVNNFSSSYGTDYNKALIDSKCCGLRATEIGKYQKVIVLMVDGLSSSETEVNKIVAEAKLQNCKIFVVSVDMKCPRALKDISTQTGGQWYENVATESKAAEIFHLILKIAQGAEPCSILWRSDANCDTSDVNIEMAWNGLKATSIYPTPAKAIHKLEVSPTTISFGAIKMGKYRDMTIKLSANDYSYTISSIKLKYGTIAFQIKDVAFPLTISKNTSYDITIRYTPTDSNLCYGGFEIETDYCSSYFSCIGGYTIKPMKSKTLNLTKPNGGESFYTNSDTLITWSGVIPSDTVTLEYSLDNGAKWILISDTATGSSYRWSIPQTPSDICLVRVTANAMANAIIVPECKNGRITIGNQTWMCRNLDVTTYRDGTPIPEVTNSSEWANLKTGAWCYYNNDPAMGAIYGKLYNWYAVNDSRGLAPEGWHIPSDKEWNILSDFLGGADIAAGKLKSKGTIEAGDGLWNSPNSGATNESGFSALPGGARCQHGTFCWIGDYGYWSMSNKYDASNQSGIIISGGSTNIGGSFGPKDVGLSVRCLKD
ncbi:MAG: FISUMP domain-containing protein [bacterium]